MNYSLHNFYALKNKKMNRLKQFSQIFLVLIFLSSCKTSIKNEDPLINSEGNINENNNLEKIADFTCRDKSEIHFLPFEIHKQDIAEVIANFEQQKIRI